MVAQKLEFEVAAKRDLVSAWTTSEGTRFQLAQRDRLLVCRATIHRCFVGGSDFVYVGRKPRVSHSR